MVKSLFKLSIPIPIMHRNADVISNLSGDFLDNIQYIKGTITTLVAVINACFPASVYCSPTVCVPNPKNKNIPIIIPDFISFFDIFFIFLKNIIDVNIDDIKNLKKIK